jgi:hypothetical protein
MKITTNADTKKVIEIRQEIRKNCGYCPTKKEHIPENLCICKEFIEQDVGECPCGLYIKLDK